MENLVVLAITMATVGQIGLCVFQLLARAITIPAYLPLVIFFVASGVVASGPVIFSLFPAWSTIYIAAIFPAWLLLCPTFWLYVEGLTSNTPWRLHISQAFHLMPFGFGLIIMGLIIMLPLEMRRAIFIDGQDIDSGFPLVVVVSVFLSTLLWAGQSGYYVIRIISRLSKYRKQLKDLFSSNDRRELTWISWLLLIIMVTWTLVFANLMSNLLYDSSLFGNIFGSTLSLLAVWTLAHWGLRQKPGFEGRYKFEEVNLINPEDGNHSKNGDLQTPKKYNRSALEKEQAQRIADKINAAMETNKLYLDPGLSLHKLSRHVAISPNYISQTLNETLGTNFFDFVNRWRIESAKPKIIANEDTILKIAYDVGFNARSSFYKVFKKETGKTPSEFRKFHSAEL